MIYGSIACVHGQSAYYRGRTDNDCYYRDFDDYDDTKFSSYRDNDFCDSSSDHRTVGYRAAAHSHMISVVSDLLKTTITRIRTGLRTCSDCG